MKDHEAAAKSAAKKGYHAAIAAATKASAKMTRAEYEAAGWKKHVLCYEFARQNAVAENLPMKENTEVVHIYGLWENYFSLVDDLLEAFGRPRKFAGTYMKTIVTP